MDLQALKDRIEKNKKKLLEDEELSSFNLYLKEYNITEGIDRVPSYVLYYLYLEFMTKHEEDLPYSKITFFKQLIKRLKRVRWGKQRYYLINKELFKLNEETEFKATLWHKNQHLKKEKTS